MFTCDVLLFTHPYPPVAGMFRLSLCGKPAVAGNLSSIHMTPEAGLLFQVPASLHISAHMPDSALRGVHSTPFPERGTDGQRCWASVARMIYFSSVVPK